MDRHIRLLDCTLRDGGHIVDGKFGETVIKDVIEGLVESNIDIVEVGFLWNEKCGKDYARFKSILDVKKVLPECTGNTKFSLMADYIDLNDLEPYNGTIEYIRLSFKRWRLDWALTTARTLMDKGYKVFINPVNNNVYSDKEYLEVIDKVNELHPYGFSIVDTFGVMRVSDLTHRYLLVENNLLKDITIGVHLHENLGLAFSLAQKMTEIADPKRNIIIDGSLTGMGRTPGNLCMEQISDFMNEQFGAGYNLDPMYDAIDNYIAPIKKENGWGYDISYALSAKFYLHRTYAEHLKGKERLKTKDIKRILSQVETCEAETFNEEYIDKLYMQYMNVKYNDEKDIKNLIDELGGKKQILIIAPGSSITEEKSKIEEKIKEKLPVFAVNFEPKIIKINADYIFLTNTKRLDSIKHGKSCSKVIITSNLIRDVEKPDYIVAYNETAFFENELCDNSVLMLVNLLGRIGVEKIFFAGFDGQINGQFEFFDNSFDRHSNKITSRDKVKKILKDKFCDIEFIFVTSSEYDD